MAAEAGRGLPGSAVGVTVGDLRSSRRAVAGVCPRFGVSSTRGLVLHWWVCVGYSCMGCPRCLAVAGPRGGGEAHCASLLTRLGIAIPNSIWGAINRPAGLFFRKSGFDPRSFDQICRVSNGHVPTPRGCCVISSCEVQLLHGLSNPGVL